MKSTLMGRPWGGMPITVEAHPATIGGDPISQHKAPEINKKGYREKELQ